MAVGELQFVIARLSTLGIDSAISGTRQLERKFARTIPGLPHGGYELGDLGCAQGAGELFDGTQFPAKFGFGVSCPGMHDVGALQARSRQHAVQI